MSPRSKLWMPVLALLIALAVETAVPVLVPQLAHGQALPGNVNTTQITTGVQKATSSALTTLQTVIIYVFALIAALLFSASLYTFFVTPENKIRAIYYLVGALVLAFASTLLGSWTIPA